MIGMETGLMDEKWLGMLQSGRLSEYMLVIHPDAAVNDKLMIEKKYFRDVYQERVEMKTKPHITVAHFWAKEEMEPTMIRWMHRIISGQKSFRLSLCNYSGFPPDTIYLRVPESQPFQQLTKELNPLNEYIKTNDCPPIKLNKKPHLAIAKKLPEAVYQKAMMDYSQRSFHEYIEVQDLMLLRRRHAFDSCVQVNKFGLQPA